MRDTGCSGFGSAPGVPEKDGGSTVEQQRRFEHKIDRSQIPVCPILGVELAAIDMPWLLSYTKDHLKEMSGDYICVANVHTTVTAFEDPSYMAIQNGGVMAIPDGGPLSTTGRKRGFAGMQRVTGPDYMHACLEMGTAQGWRHYFYGGTQQTLDTMAGLLPQRYPGVQIAGMYSPPFRPLTAEEDAAAVKAIQDAQPDFVWVGLGAPKQEIWMHDHQGRIPGLMVGVGAAFDYEAGNIKRAPQWMQDQDLEWLYRLMQDPKRLYKRYLHTNRVYLLEAELRGK